MGESPTVEITREEKIFPEENYEFEGTVNGKNWSAKKTYGHGASTFITDSDDLTDEEQKAVFAELRNR